MKKLNEIIEKYEAWEKQGILNDYAKGRLSAFRTALKIL